MIDIASFERSFSLSEEIKKARLSVRAGNVLNNNVKSLEELLSLDRNKLAGFRNCGHKTIVEILDFQQTIYRKIGTTVRRGNFEHQPDNSSLAFPPERKENPPLDHQKDFQELVYTSGLSVRAKNVLIKKVKSLEKFLDLNETQLFGLRNSGKKTVAELLRFQDVLRLEIGLPSTTEKTADSVVSAQLIFSNSREEIDFYQFMCDMSGVRENNVLIKNQINTLEKFIKLNIASMRRLKNCGKKTITKFINYQNAFLEIVNSQSENKYSDNKTIDISSLSLDIKKQFQKLIGKKGRLIDSNAPYHTLMEWVSDLSSIMLKSEDAKTAFLLRYGMTGDPPQTLEEIGGKLGVTRERVRQILKKMERTAKGPHRGWRLKPLFRSAAHLVDARGGKLNTAELVAVLLAKGPQGESLKHATTFMEFLSSFTYWDSEGLILDKEGHVCTSKYMRIIRLLSPYIVNMAKENADEILGNDLWSIDIKILKKLIIDKYNSHEREDNIIDISDIILDNIFSTHDTKIKRDFRRLYSRDYWDLRFGSISNASLAILRHSNKPLHFSEVYSKLLEFRSEDNMPNEHAVHASIDRFEEIYLWGRGTFVHENNITIPHDVISEIEKWLLKKLRKNVPFISVYGPFIQFKDICISSNIPNEIALYSLLRHLSHPLLIYPRLPYIYLEDNYEYRIPNILAIEQFIQDTDGPVSYKKLKHFVKDMLFLKDYQFAQGIASVPNVVRTKNGGFIHSDFLNLEEDIFNDILYYTREIIRKEGHVSVRKIFQDKMVSCKIIGIDSHQGLFSLFQLLRPDEFDLRNYLTLRFNKDTGEEEKSRSIVKEIADYLEKEGRPCGYHEIYEIFVEGLGYKERIIYDCSREDCVRQYSGDSLVHTETLGLDVTKMEKIDNSALELYNGCEKRGECYALIAKLVESNPLPNLKPGLYWTKALLADCLAKSGKFRVLGNTRNAYIPKANRFNINNLEDLVYEILKNKYNGAANLSEFSNELAMIGIVKKRITPGMFPDQEKIVFIGKEIMTKELSDYA